MKALLFITALASAGCLRTTTYHCTTNENCGAGSTCEGTGFCSVADSACGADGRRYVENSGTLSNKCVGDVLEGDGGVDSPVDTLIADVPFGNCQMTYGIIHNGHRYRVIAGTQSWTMQKAACEVDGTNKYLAIPNDQAELTAIVTAATATAWVGVEDAGPDDQNMQDVKGTVFPTGTGLWAASEPNDMQTGSSGNPTDAECVAAVTANSGKLMDDRCAIGYAAVCECEP